jgi:cell division transport system ATP-binding protein
MAQIEFHGVTKRFDNGQEGLANVNAEFAEGSMSFLTGHSGAGKSTFLKLLLCLDQPSRGQILVNGVNVTRISGSRLAHYRISGMKEKDIARRVRAALSRVGLLEKERLFPRYLSTGEQQRVGIARAVVTRPKILLADEPTGNLDPELSRDIMKLFEQFNQVGTTVIVASHDRDLIESMGMRIIELDRGAIVGDRVDTRRSVDGDSGAQAAGEAMDG